MHFQRFCVLVVFIVSTFLLNDCSSATELPSFINPCNNTSPDCLKRAIQTALKDFISGVPELGIESLDPFVINKLKLTLPGGLVVEFVRGTSTGLKNCIVESTSFVQHKLDIVARCNLLIKGKYKSSGRLLMFAINGDGDSMIKCRNIKMHFVFKLGTISAAGKKYFEVTSLNFRHSFDGQVTYRMTNLIKGNPQLTNLVVMFMNNNWRMVAEEFGKPIVDYGAEAVLKNVKKLFDAVPVDQLIRAPINI